MYPYEVIDALALDKPAERAPIFLRPDAPNADLVRPLSRSDELSRSSKAAFVSMVFGATYTGGCAPPSV